ncbi:arsenic resistance N-acetyltransferase ArsN2 [Natronobiforma cellulositropha]|uniref:arsenic resistance N-acetyltransferase ArsN2 n=1 Tax=Natronobiforma cellulositropha TaxID=1679076 RepID=UPI0021D60884|nr:arsenic resistance N-acetyltransferase ArsN2 [Natronobiforma cellulositropha]
MPTGLRLERADETTISTVERLLEASGLPSADVRSSPACFYLARDGATRVGVGGLERYGGDGLLRSVAVEPRYRSTGYGTALCDALEAKARAEGVERLYLLTTTAAAFFDRLGYAELERTDVPAAIRETSEFTSLCPASATVMEKSLLE